jgi:hypothetical protein
MTRFKELARIEPAIAHNNKSELEWALGYCKMRLGIAPRKDHQKYWHKVERQVRAALSQAQPSARNVE